MLLSERVAGPRCQAPGTEGEIISYFGALLRNEYKGVLNVLSSSGVSQKLDSSLHVGKIELL